MKKPFLFLCILLSVVVNAQKRDTVYADFPKDFQMKVNLRHDYTKTFVTKIFMSQALFDGRFKHRDNGKQTVYATCEQTLQLLKGMDNITLGMPKIAYLVGWQYNGHDSKYPAFFEGNEALKRPNDKNGLESIRWLMAEGKKYNTTVSLHINMIDTYEDSPLWNKYIANDVIARDERGFLRGGEWGYQISYAQEWAKGFTQQRIDSLCKLLPIQDAGTIHIDAFHTAAPIAYKDEKDEWQIRTQSPISSYLPYTQKDELEAQRNIFRYFDSKGIDVTNEGLPDNTDLFIGYQPMVWWFGHDEIYLKYPASIICGGNNADSDWGVLFGNNLNGEKVFMKGLDNYSEFTRRFCTMTAVCNYLNRFERLYRVEGENYKAVQFSGNVHSELDKGHLQIRQGNAVLVDNNNVMIPALWIEGNHMIAYSQDGYKEKIWTLPSGYPVSGKVSIYAVNESGRFYKGKLKYSSGKLKLRVNAGEMLLLSF